MVNGYNDYELVKDNIIYDDIEYIEMNTKIQKSKFNIYQKYIDTNITKNKFIGNIILKELVEKTLHPKRLLDICNKYKISFEELLDNY